MEEHHRRKTDNKGWGLFGLLFGISLGMGIIGGLSLYLEQDVSSWRTKIVEHGCGHYSSTTGKFVWKEPSQ